MRPPTDWDRVIALAEALLAAPPARNALYATLPLAGALHQRACLAFARGDVAAARADLDRAVQLDPDRPYLTTRAVVRLAQGDVDGALADAECALVPEGGTTARPSRFGGTDGRPGALDDATRERATAVIATARLLRRGG